MELIDRAILSGFDAEAFGRKQPFPWYGFEGVLGPGAFARLCAEFPPLELFERHEGIEREYRQSPHGRYYLAYERSTYHDDGPVPKQGVVAHDQLSPGWRAFIEELESDDYRQFLGRAFGASDFRVRERLRHRNVQEGATCVYQPTRLGGVVLRHLAVV